MAYLVKNIYNIIMITVEGYNGIMELDLTNIDSKYHKILIQEHYKDIEKYKKEQALLPKKLRYENQVGRALKKMEKEQLFIQNQVAEQKRLQQIKDETFIRNKQNYLQNISKFS